MNISWERMPIDIALLGGDVAAFPVGVIPELIDGWTEGYGGQLGNISYNATAGSFTIVRAGWYRLSAHISGAYTGNANNTDITLGLRVSGTATQNGDYSMWNVGVASPQTSLASFAVPSLLVNAEANATFQLYMEASGSIGDMLLEFPSFQIEEVWAPYPGEAPA